MRFLLATVLLAALSGVAVADGFVARNLPLKALAGMLPGEESGWEVKDWGEDPVGPPELLVPKDEKRSAPGIFAWFAPQFQAGGMVPFLSKKAGYGGGFTVGASCKIGLKTAFPHWIRPSVDMGFISAEEDYWEGTSTLLLIHVDGGIDWLRTDSLRGSVFLTLGGGFEFFSAEEKVGGGEDLSETNMNFLGGAGGSFGIALTKHLDVEAVLRLSFPLGSRNVRGLLLAGVSVSYRL